MFRRNWAEKYGFGFELPALVPNVSKSAARDEAAEAA
jgi:hypothetical protein